MLDLQRLAGNRAVAAAFAPPDLAARRERMPRQEGAAQRTPTGAGQPVVQRKVDLEFDLNYGTGMASDPEGLASETQFDGAEDRVTSHTKASDGFEVVQDGNRIEIATMRFRLGRRGAADLNRTFNRIKAFTAGLRGGAAGAAPQTPTRPTSPMKSGPLGRVRAFALPSSLDGDRRFFPLGTRTYFRTSTSVGGAPQASIDVPLGKIPDLVKRIRRSESKRPGVALTGPRRGASGRRVRPGLRSTELYAARTAVLAERRRRIRQRMMLPSGVRVGSANFTPALAGFMIMMVSYLNTSKINRRGDFEAFAKAYPPIVTHTHFRDMYHRILKPAEREVFEHLYVAHPDRFWVLAIGGGSAGNLLFPTATHAKQIDAFGSVPTWGALFDKTVNDEALLDTSGSESMFTPLAKAKDKPTRAGPKRSRFDPVTGRFVRERERIGTRLELRRIGFAWVPSDAWHGLAKRVMAMTRELNR